MSQVVYVPPDPSLAWPIPYEAVSSIGEEEGLRYVAYQCIAGKWTIGRGHTGSVHPNDKCDLAQADRWFLDDIVEACDAVKSLCTVIPDDNQLGALTSLVFNIGIDDFKRSSVLKLHNKGDYPGAANAFLLYNKYHDPSGALRTSEDLDARRHREAAEYLKPMPGVQPAMPQAVAPQPSLVASPTMNAGALTTGVGALALLTQVSDAVKQPISDIIGFAHDLGITPGYMVAGVALTLGIVVMYRRFQQRAAGKA